MYSNISKVNGPFLHHVFYAWALTSALKIPTEGNNKQTNKQTHTEGYLLSAEIVMDRGMHRAKSLLRIGLSQDNHKQSLKLACTLKPSSEYNLPVKNLKNIW